MEAPLIAVKGLSKRYRMGDTEVKALDGVDLSIGAGEFVAIMGPSGSGKSTLMHVLGLLDVPDGGSYQLYGEEVSKLSEDELAARRSRSIGFIFQQFNLLPRTSATENVALPQLYADGRLDPAWAGRLLDLVGLGSRAHHRPSELSGGQQQRVAIARALTNKPRIILADEPTGNLDSVSEREIMAMLTELNRQGITVVIVTHEPEMARHVRRVIRMRDGKVQSDEAGGAEALATAANSSQLGDLSGLLASDGSAAVRRRTAVWTGLWSHLQQAFRSLLANKVRTILSMLGILIGVAAVIAMLALGAGARESIEKQLSSLGSNLLVLRPGGYRTGAVSLGAAAVSRLTVEDAADLRSLPGVRYVSPTVSGRAQTVRGDKNWNTYMNGVGPAYPSMRAATPILGRFFTEEENSQRARVAVIGATVARELFGADRDPLGETVLINRVAVQVIGVLPVKGNNGWQDQDDIVVTPILTAMHRILGRQYVDSIDIEVASPDAMATVQDDVLRLINSRHHVRDDDDGAYQIRNMADIQEALSATSRIMSMLLAAIASISLLVGGIGIMNIMLVSVTERTREIGLRKALGATRGSIQAQFLVEAGVVSAWGGLMGIGLGIALSVGLASLAEWPVRIMPQSVVLAAAFSVGIGIVFGFWPARKASALSPIEALRHE